MAKRDYYDVLGCGKDAQTPELKKAYRRLAMKYHPDRNQDNPEAENQFKEAKEAYEILSDSEKRAAYDQFGHAGVQAGQAGAGFGAGGEAFSDLFGDVFGDIFGGGRRSRSQVFRGADLRFELELSLEQAVAGDSVNIEIPTQVECQPCNGSGAEPGTKPATCTMCGGAGQVRAQQGFFSIQQTCPTCKGTGSVIQTPCGTCNGRGRVRKVKTLAVKVPAGVDSGDRIRLAQEGEAGRNGGPSGDLYVDINVKPHRIFERDGRNLSCDVPIGFAAGVLGSTVDVPTLDGQVALKIPPETQSGRVFRLRGKGVRSVRVSGVGDLFCRVQIETPVHLTDEQKRLLRQFDESIQAGGSRHSPRARSWVDGVKKFFERMGA
ncbi:MAG: molecular chaperone DnaJ [Gammaproteobacteria bacterium]